MLEKWKHKAKILKKEIYALYLACQDPRVPWFARLIAIIVVGYALSPIDLIPDPIPVLGYLDDLILVPLGIAWVIKMVPADVLNECREKAGERLSEDKPQNWIAAGVIILIWLFLLAAIVFYIIRFNNHFGREK